MRTGPGWWRWLVSCDGPGRRRPTSACKSASHRGRPGGPPSTTQPSAGPWLSPKLVTVKTRPNVLPATRFPLSQASSSSSLFVLITDRVQIPRPQQEHSAAAHRNLRPNEREPPKGAQQRVFGIADFHDQNAVAAEVPPRPGEDRAHRIEAIGARGKPNSRLVLILAREFAHFRAPDIGRIAHDDIVTAALHRVEIIRLLHPDALFQFQAAEIASGHFQRSCGHVDGIH